MESLVEAEAWTRGIEDMQEMARRVLETDAVMCKTKPSMKNLMSETNESKLQ